jgi:hypothetical protein
MKSFGATILKQFDVKYTARARQPVTEIMVLTVVWSSEPM